MDRPLVDTKHMACQSDNYLMTYDVTCQTPTKSLVTQVIQCELLKENQVVFEDKDMQIMIPNVVEKIPEPLLMSNVSNQTSPRNQ